MGRITGFKIQNYGPLRDIAIGYPSDQQVVGWPENGCELGNMAAFIGSNGSGKSSFADVFSFISDCVSSDVETACNSNHRGGYDQLVSKKSNGPIAVTILYTIHSDESSFSRIVYHLEIARDGNHRPFILGENISTGGDSPLLMFVQNGKGFVMEHGEQGLQGENGEHGSKRSGAGEEELKSRVIELSDLRRPAVVTLGEMKQYPEINGFLDFLKSWYLCYFSPDAARRTQTVAPSPWLSRTGDNINNVAQYMYRENPGEFKAILTDIQSKIPDIERIEPIQLINGQMELAFYQKGFTEPFYSSRMSDGTLKLFAYYLMLHEKNPRQLVFIEEPENGLYHHYLADLASEMKRSAGTGFDKQFFVTTHSPFFVNALLPEQVWVLDRGADGFTTAKRASEYPFVKDLTEEGVSMGDLWYSRYFG